jgi:1,2-phenylacetyl-CoA epoxidase catalytic subunit
MNNACETLGQPIVEGNLTILQMMAEIDRLKQENEQLESERNQWRNDYIALHNKVVNEESITFEDGKLVNNNNEGGWTDEEFDIVANAYAEAEKDYKFV